MAHKTVYTLIIRILIVVSTGTAGLLAFPVIADLCSSSGTVCGF